MRYVLTSLVGLLVLASGEVSAKTGFLVAAPDRGFLGNGETRELFEPFSSEWPAELVFVTDERSEPYFRQAVSALKEQGASSIVLLPFYLSGAHPDFDRLRSWAVGDGGVPITFGRPFGRSYLAVHALSQQLERLPGDADNVIVAGHGAGDRDQATRMRADLERLAHAASDRFDFDEPLVIVTIEGEDLEPQLAGLEEGSVVLPFHLGPKYSSMMAHTRWIGRAAPEGVTVLDGDVTPHESVSRWMRREAARYAPLPASKVGVIVHAHGSDFHWNETMRDAAAPLAGDFIVEYAFSMGDPVTLQRAVERLEERGARAVVIVRVFGMSSSFRGNIERFIGADYENCRQPPDTHMHHGTAPRLKSHLPVVTLGGLDDHRYFARALLERARALSHDPARETIILVAHGKGDEDGNGEWLDTLESLRAQMLSYWGDAFRAIEVGTWREDWPEKRDNAMSRIRSHIETAQEDEGRAIVIPARTTAQGPARELIPDLEFELGEGFAPHPLFVEWLREQVNAGRNELTYAQPASWACSPERGTE